jgi:hypothetical protein
MAQWSSRCPLVTKSRVQVDNLFTQTADSLSHWLNFLADLVADTANLKYLRGASWWGSEIYEYEIWIGGFSIFSWIAQLTSRLICVSHCKSLSACVSLYFRTKLPNPPKTPRQKVACTARKAVSSPRKRLHVSPWDARCQSWQSGECKLVHLLKFTN